MFHCTTSLLFPPVFPTKSAGCRCKKHESSECPFLPFPARESAWAGVLPSKNFHVKKGCEEMISIFSQSLSVISFRYPHAGRTFASILPPAIYIPQTWMVFPASTGMDRRKTSVVFLKSSRCRTPIIRHIISPAGV